MDPIDPAALDIQYIQTQKTKLGQSIQVRSIEPAHKNPALVDQWLAKVSELHKSRPPPTVQYSKNMPDVETLMQEWPAEIEDALASVVLPRPEVDLKLDQYAQTICVLMDIPVHKLSNKKGLVEALHVLFSLYAEFKENPHFKHPGEPAVGEGKLGDQVTVDSK